MLEIKFVRQNLSLIKKMLHDRATNVDMDAFAACDASQRDHLAKIEALRHKRNTVSEQIAAMKRNQEDASNLMAEMREVGSDIKTLEKSLEQSAQIVKQMIMEIPNLPHETVPIGQDETANVVANKVGSPPKFGFQPQAHWDLGTALKILDFERAAKIAGSRFPLYMGMGARMERALINLMLDIHTSEHGYTEVLPPFMVNRNTMTNTGQLPKFEQDLFKIEGWDYFLIPTAEVPVTNIHQNEILAEEQLPVYYTAYTPCFRSEAGSHGKDTRGLIRQHQFNKVELVKFVKPENSYGELEKLLKDAETILQRLELPYQLLSLCTGDLGFSAAKTYDLEVWMPAQGVYREISSCSNFESFQARRAGIRFRRKGQKKAELVHTLNGSGLAVGRTVAAILENYQNEDGSVTIPTALKPYMGTLDTIRP
jgi:seryl-tRNA synthetase